MDAEPIRVLKNSIVLKDLLSLLRKIILVLAVGILLIVGNQALRIAAASGKLPYSIKPFQINNPSAKFRMLFLGDSTAVGTGASLNTESTAGWFGKDYPQAHIRNFSRNGLRIAGLLKKFNPPAKQFYSVVIIQIGGNDIMRFTPLGSIKRDLSVLIDRAKTVGRHVVILHSGNVGAAPIFVWPFDRILTERTRAVRALYVQLAQEKGVLYVDLFQEKENDPFLRDIGKFYAKDLLHPSGKGYRFWYGKIREALLKVGVS